MQNTNAGTTDARNIIRNAQESMLMLIKTGYLVFSYSLLRH